jgi:hypothetical protein
MTPEETLDWLAQQHFDRCREERPIQNWIRHMKRLLPNNAELVACQKHYEEQNKKENT